MRFGTVLVITADALAASTLRVYQHCFSDWRVLFHGGAANGGHDAALDVDVVAISTQVGSFLPCTSRVSRTIFTPFAYH